MGQNSYFFLTLSFVLVSLLLVNVGEGAPSKETTAKPSATTGVTKSGEKEEGNEGTTVKSKASDDNNEGGPTVAPADGEGNRTAGDEAEAGDKKGKDGKSILKDKTDEFGAKIKGSANQAKGQITKWGESAKDSLSSFFG